MEVRLEWTHLTLNRFVPSSFGALWSLSPSQPAVSQPAAFSGSALTTNLTRAGCCCCSWRCWRSRPWVYTINPFISKNRNGIVSVSWLENASCVRLVADLREASEWMSEFFVGPLKSAIATDSKSIMFGIRIRRSRKNARDFVRSFFTLWETLTSALLRSRGGKIGERIHGNIFTVKKMKEPLHPTDPMKRREIYDPDAVAATIFWGGIF